MFHIIWLQNGPMNDFHEGRKTHEFRLSTFRAPFMLARPGHRALLKRTCGEVELLADIVAVHSFDRDSPEGALAAFIERWGPDNAYLLSKPRARYGAAIRLGNLRRRTFPSERLPRGVRMGWVADFDVGNWRP